MQRPEIRPDAGFCIQTDSLSKAGGRWYLNMVRHSLCEMPVGHSGKSITKEFILVNGIGSMKIPFDMGSFRKLKERAEGHKQTAYCVDVVWNPFIIAMFMDDNFNATMKEYRPFIINLALKRIESSIGVKLSTEKVKLVKKFFYKDGEGNSGQEPKEFTELPQEMECEEEMQPSAMPPAPAPEEPLIQDVTPGQRKKQAMKKGFFNNDKGGMYPPEGSNEGVMPENAGDPMGYLPKKLRQSCKIVDTNSPEYQETERKKKAAEEHNAQNKEFSDMLQQDLGKWNKPNQQWAQDDAPDGPEEAPMAKFSNDYSRFDKIEDIEDKPEVEQRDWWYDEKGVRHSHSTAKGSSAPAGSSAAPPKPAVKKGFLDGAKGSLYPEGSGEGSQAPVNEADLIKGLERAYGSDDAELIKQFKEISKDQPEGNAPPGAKKPSMVVKGPDSKTPEFTLERNDNDGLLELSVNVPGLESMKGVELDVTDNLASIVFPSSIKMKPLKVELPAAVVPSGVKAKFSKKTSQITVKLPLFLKVAKAG